MESRCDRFTIERPRIEPGPAIFLYSIDIEIERIVIRLRGGPPIKSHISGIRHSGPRNGSRGIIGKGSGNEAIVAESASCRSNLPRGSAPRNIGDPSDR